MTYSVHQVSSDEFGIIPGPGFAIFERGKRIDWPMLATRAEAEAEARDFRREMRRLASDEASERRFLVA